MKRVVSVSYKQYIIATRQTVSSSLLNIIDPDNNKCLTVSEI